MPEKESIVAAHFEDAEQQYEAANLGMWVFIATEILFFSGLFLAYLVYRHFYFSEFGVASQHTNLLFGTINSIVLLTSSFTMAMAVQAAKGGETKSITRYLAGTVTLGVIFLIIKGLEYHQDIIEQLVPGVHFNPALPRAAQIFFWLYWVMTGLHGLHVLIGLALITIMIKLARKNIFSSHYHTPLELTGLYWHFVDIVWLFLYPLLYLVHR